MAPTRSDPYALRARGRATHEQGWPCRASCGSAPRPKLGCSTSSSPGWELPGLYRRNPRQSRWPVPTRRTPVGPIEAHSYAALKSGDMSFDEMQELDYTLSFTADGDDVLGRDRSSRPTGSDEDRRTGAPPELRPLEMWNPDMDREPRLQNGEDAFARINRMRAVGRTSPYLTTSIPNFVLGEVWHDRVSR